jgi:quinol monooxygenase YgiN
MIVVAAKFVAKPERKSEGLQLAATVAAHSRTEAGCISYNFYEQPGNNECLFFEEWVDQKALDEHFRTLHFVAFSKQLPGMIVGAAKIRVYEVSGMRDL